MTACQIAATMVLAQDRQQHALALWREARRRLADPAAADPQRDELKLIEARAGLVYIAQRFELHCAATVLLKKHPAANDAAAHSPTEPEPTAA